MGLLLALWGIAKGVFNTFAGVMTMGDEAIANMVGQGTKGGFKMGARQFARGMTQIFLIDSPTGSKTKRPKTSKAKQVQAAKPPKPQTKQVRTSNVKQVQAAKPKQEPPKPQTKQVQAAKTEPKKDSYLQRSLADGEPRPNAKWLALVNNYENARKRNRAAAMRDIQFLMSQADPAYYVWLLREIKKKKGKKVKG